MSCILLQHWSGFKISATGDQLDASVLTIEHMYPAPMAKGLINVCQFWTSPVSNALEGSLAFSIWLSSCYWFKEHCPHCWDFLALTLMFLLEDYCQISKMLGLCKQPVLLLVCTKKGVCINIILR